MNYYYLTRNQSLTQVHLKNESPYVREIELLEGNNKGKVLKCHPEGVAWGTMYPRLFKAENKPQNVFSFKGRALVGQFELTEKNAAAVPISKPYRFQPFIKDVIDSIHARENVLLTGGTGVGKTTHLVELAARIQQPMLRVNLNGETRMSDFIGKMTVLNGQTVWVDGILPTAMRLGYWLLLDELDFADPSILSLLHPVLEVDPMLTLKENSGEIIRAHPLFRVFGTANSIGAMSERSGAYTGTNDMNEAFLDRWQVIYVDNLPEKEELMVIRNNAPGLNAAVAKKMVKFANMARKQDFKDPQAIYSGDNFSTRKLISWAKKAALHRDPFVGAQKSWLDKLPLSEQSVMSKIIITHFGTRQRKSNSVKNLLGKKTTVQKIVTPVKRGRGRPKKV